MGNVIRTEYGWPAHFISSHKCLFRRHTQLTYNNTTVVVSTVGQMILDNDVFEIGSECFFETKAYYANDNIAIKDADISRPIDFDSVGVISEPHKFVEANDMHEAVVSELIQKFDLYEEPI